MCGIAGILSLGQNPPEHHRLQAMLRSLSHRGPDGQGRLDRGRCHLLHNRLSVLDAPGGNQPMQAAHCPTCAHLSVVFNGEIYNHRDLRRELQAAGHVFASDHSDTEVLLHGFSQWGTDLPRRLEGMFAFALWDERAEKLFLVRDRIGKKPLYVRCLGHGATRELMFASLVSTLVLGSPRGDEPSIDPQALSIYLQLGYTFDRSLLAGVTEIHAGSWMSVDRDGRLTMQHYWSPPEPVLRDEQPAPQRIAAARELIRAAIARRLEADVPLGCFLSGGIDSSVIAGLAQEHLRSIGAPPLRTFTVAMPDPDFDESEDARAIAAQLGTNHTELQLTSELSPLDDVQRLISLTGEPTGDSSILPTYWISKLTRQHVTVALSGDGGDELFAGYDRYRALRLIALNRWWLASLPGGVLGVQPARSTRARLRRLIDAAQHNDPSQQYLHIVRLFSQQQVNYLGVAATAEPMIDWNHSLSVSDAARSWDVLRYLPFDLLRKVDRASMAVALEVRCPMLDREVCEWALGRMSRSLNIRGVSKSILRSIAAEFLPLPIARRRKRGFGLPGSVWLSGKTGESVRQCLLDGSLLWLGIDQGWVERLWMEHTESRADHTHRLFSLLTLAVWSDWMRSRRTAG